jgi:two-component system NtrC family sensor kinase
MKLSAYSLRTGIFAILVTILLAAMILLDFVMVRTAERDMLKTEIRSGLLFLRAIEQIMVTDYTSTKYAETQGGYPSHKQLHQLLYGAPRSSALIIDNYGKILFETEIREEKRKKLLGLARESLQRRENSSLISGATWGILPLRRGDLFLASPITREKRIVGAASVKLPLQPMYATIKASQKILLSYVLLNTLFLAIAGFFLIYRAIIRPIDRLVKRAEEFKEGETFFLSSDTDQNEFGRLSSALSMMLRRLEANKLELKQSISSLEKANLELRQAQEEIIRSEKLASVGRLASGVAHEIGNPIGIIFGYLDLLRDNDLKKEERADIINRIQTEIDRINRTIRNLLDFSRPSKREVRAVSVHHIILEMLDMLKPQPMMADIKVTLDHGADDDTVLADPDRLKQVFLNIVMNAVDAMEVNETKDGSPHKILSIGIGVLSETQPEKRGNGKAVSIEFSDNGSGISAEDANRIFDPFYTTKDPGKGTGLGLSVSLRIVEDMGGDIKVKSEKGKGTTMTVILPHCVKDNHS